MLALLFLGLSVSAELLKVDFTSSTTFKDPVIERRDILRPVFNDLAHQVSCLLLKLTIFSLIIH